MVERKTQSQFALQMLRFLGIAVLTVVQVQSNVVVTHAASGDAIADRVLGQTDFTSGGSGSGTNQMYEPRHVTVDSAGRIFVADMVNHRVLGWPNATAFTNGMAATIVITSAGSGGLNLFYPRGVATAQNGDLYVADAFNNRVLQFTAPISSASVAVRVFGQLDFASGAANQGGLYPGANTLNNPTGVAVDTNGNVYVADTENSRALVYNAPINPTANISATKVLGQQDFVSGDPNQGGGSTATARKINRPFAVAVDSSGKPYVGDTYNNRVLRYDVPLAITNTAASLVIGQPDFSSTGANQGGGFLPSAQTLYYPYGIALDSAGNLYVADMNNNRVLAYMAPLTSPNMAATLVIGQTTFSEFVNATTDHNFRYPGGVGVDSAKNVYVGDTNNHRVLAFDNPFDKRFYLPLIRKQ